MRKNKSELEKELVYKPIYLPVRFFKKEAYIHIDDYKEAINKRENAVNGLEEENKKLNEFKEKRKEGRFYFKAQMERAEPKTAREAEDLQRAKELFERLYREELSYLEEENKKLKERIDELEKCNLNLQERLDRKEELNKSYRKEIKDHQLYEEKLERRIIEFEELLHGE